MLSISSGHSAEYLTGQVAQGRENYYLDATTAGEPPGRWWGSAAEAFGLVGEVDNDVMTALYTDFLDPRDPRFADPATRADSARLGNAPGRYKSAEQIVAERLAAEPGALPERVREIELEAAKQARQPVMFIDATFSPVKSFTVLHTALQRAELEAERAGDEEARVVWADMRADAEAALWAGNNAMLGVLSDKAGYSRAGRHGAGAGRWVDAHDWTVASFHQSDSRDHDPQQHIHNAILNRVVCDDGEVRSLDSRAIHEAKQQAGALGERVMEEELSARLGVEWVMRPDETAREIAGISQDVMDLFSERSAHIGKKAQALVAEFEVKFGREPNALELSRLRQQSTKATRRAKVSEGETHGARLDRWDRMLRQEVAGGLSRVAEQVRAGTDRGPVAAEKFSPEGIIAEAIAACQEKQAVVSESELARQLALRMPSLGGMPAADIIEFVGGLTTEALAKMVQVTGAQPGAAVPEDLKLANGRSVYAAPGGPKYATKEHIVAEQALRRAMVERGRVAAPAFAVDRWMRHHGQDLGADQDAAVRGLLTSGAAVSVLVGPAGTGKSFTLGRLSEGWGELLGGRVFGLATSQIATEVLAEDGVQALNTSRWLGVQRRLGEGKAAAVDAEWALTSRDAVVVDESSMVDTAVLTEIRRRVEEAGARLILTGDPRQLAAVGAGGAMDMISADHGADVHTLAEVRRFNAEWERAASLRLREGDVSVLGEYDRHGRILDAGTAEHAHQLVARAYLGDVLDERSSLVVTPTNREAAKVAGLIRDELVALGRVEADGVLLGLDGNTCGVGDLVQTRRNDYDLAVVNRRRYVVERIHRDGGITVVTENGQERHRLPADYVEEHVTLGYASTAHSAQGVTVDTGHFLTAGQTTAEGQYVGLTRGRDSNTAYVVTIAERDDEVTGETHARDRQQPLSVLADVLARDTDTDAAALVQAAEDARQAGSMHTLAARWEDGVRQVTRMRLETDLDELTAGGVLSLPERDALAADQGSEQLSRLLRVVEQAGHDPREALRDAINERSLAGAKSLAQVLHHRINSTHRGQLAPVPDLSTVAPAEIPTDWREYLAELDQAAEDRRRELGAELVDEPEAWAVEALGPVPSDEADRVHWEYRAGVAAAYREATGWDHEVEPIGPAPGMSSTERRAAWHDAWAALGRPESTPEEQELSEGGLRLRVKAWEREQAWQPADVYLEERATAQQAATHRQEAARLDAEAQAAADSAEADRLLQEAQDRRAMAATLTQIEDDLAEVAEARTDWLAETAITRELAERAQAELAARGRPIGDEPDRITAEEWLAEHRAAVVEDDQHRPITEVDVLDPAQAEVGHETAAPSRTEADIAEAEPPLEREADTAAETQMPAGVPTPVEVDAAVTAAALAADEIAARTAAEEQHRIDEATRQAAELDAAREQHYREAAERSALENELER